MVERGHTGVMLTLLRNHEDKANWKKALQGPFPKLISGFEYAGNVAAQLVHSKLEIVGWRKEMGIAESNEPVSGRFYSFDKIAPCSGDIAAIRAARVFVDELNSIGCHAISILHHFDTPEGVMGQLSLFLPHTQPTGKSETKIILGVKEPNETEKKPNQQVEHKIVKGDVDGAAIFLAYLLDKGWVTEKEIIDADEKADYNTMNVTTRPPFSKAILTLAKSPSIQSKIKSLHIPAHSDAQIESLGR